MIKRRKFESKPKPQRYYALLEDMVGSIEGNNYSRSHVLLDGVDAARFDENPLSLNDPSALSLIRAISTERVWRNRHDLGEVAKGDWVEISLHDEGQAPMAWEMRPDNDYRRDSKRSVEKIRRIGRILPAGGATGDNPELVMKLQAGSNAARGDHQTIAFQNLASRVLPASPPPVSNHDDKLEIIVLDVGQASAVLMRRNGTAIGLFDAGHPLWFNKKSLPRHFVAPDLGNGFIFLSHWDFDHFEMGRLQVAWHQNDWFAPDQLVGPNTALFQRLLGARLTFVDGPLIIGGLHFERGTCLDPVDRNNTGYQMRYERDGKAVLLTGDADYEHIAPHMKADLTHLCIPHHGGRGTAPPGPNGTSGRAVVSYGLPNGYRHPYGPQIHAHRGLGWTVAPTADDHAPRGDRLLFSAP
ncbi:hypothetical protein [Rhizobium redzepovicii]|uniref:hypothetical protein n=1 Tax=Rhizobium redzepovicii TaxID=2867518 RepID=UPI001C933FD9|nr:hypothetical protein [Rhizobium redzepovicii]MBY4616143.1 hypothetical protein [Rhizobium redzepovicii]